MATSPQQSTATGQQFTLTVTLHCELLKTTSETELYSTLKCKLMARKSKSKARQGDELSAPLLNSDSSSSAPAAAGSEKFEATTDAGSKTTGAPPANDGYADSSGAPGYQASGALPAGAPRYPVVIPPLIASPGFAYGTPDAGYPTDTGIRADPNYSYYYPGTPNRKPIPKQPVDPRNQIEIGAWATGLFSCFDSCVPNFFMAFACPCVSLAQIYARVGLWSYSSALAYFACYYVVGWLGYASFVFSPQTTTYNNYDDVYVTSSMVPEVVSIFMMVGHLAFLLAVRAAREKVREYYDIPGTYWDDCFTSCCCSCCAIAQLATHAKSYTPGSCSFRGPDELPPFQV